MKSSAITNIVSDNQLNWNSISKSLFVVSSVYRCVYHRVVTIKSLSTREAYYILTKFLMGGSFIEADKMRVGTDVYY